MTTLWHPTPPMEYIHGKMIYLPDPRYELREVTRISHGRERQAWALFAEGYRVPQVHSCGNMQLVRGDAEEFISDMKEMEA